MKYWKEKQNNPVENMQFWTGTYITKLAENEIFLYGSNPQGINGAGAAKAAMSLSKGAKHGVGRGFNGSNAYALVTKSLNAGFLEKGTGIVYEKEGFRSVSPAQIRDNIKEMYEVARQPEYKNKKFLVTYQYESWPNGSPKKSLNGYTSQEILEMFAKDQDVPPNIVFHDSYKPHLENLYKNQNKQSDGELIVYENDKSIDIKEENIIWTIDSDERNPEGINGAGAAKAAMKFGLIYGKSSGLQNQAYGLITKNLTVGFIDENGFKYEKEGFCSVSPEQIRANIDELYKTANLPEHKNKKFLVSYQYETYPNGTQKKSLNGYTSQEMLEMFVKDQVIPPNIVFHDSYQVHLEKILSQNLKQDKSPIFNVLPNLLVVSPRDKVPEGFTVLNTTSKDKEIGTKFSPFYLSNIELYEGRVAKNMENAWQFSKVYTEFADDKGNPTEAYFNWAEKGWSDSFAHRYANGKGNAPIYSYWKTLEGDKWTEHKWDYVTARKNIYFPLYAKAIIKTPAFQELKSRVERGEKIALWDFDGYNHAEKQMTYENVVNSAQYKCGHAFVLYGLLTGELKVMDDKLVYDFDLKIPANAIPVKQDKEPEYTYFFQATSPFSQWHPSKFTYKELDFICTEQFMMYAKAKTFGDHLVADKIMNIQDCFTYRKPGVKFENKEDEDCYNLVIDFKECRIDRNQIVDNYKTLNTWKKVQGVIKKLGREVSNYNEQVWVDKRVPVVSVANREKYNQNPDLKAILMATEDSIMVESSPYDKLSTTQQIVHNALLDLREYFKQQNKPKMK